ncbi:MAG: arsenate reductase ArsC [Desulfofustis sp.]
MKIKILFLCTGNSSRSQIAEGWCRYLKSKEIEAYSAGIEKHGLNPLAVAVMAEVGVDISKQRSKTTDELPVSEFDWVITLCDHANETCPHFHGRKKHVGFDDPTRLSRTMPVIDKRAVYRRVRDEIRRFVESLPGALEPEPY